jgi:hypothetical protein
VSVSISSTPADHAGHDGSYRDAVRARDIDKAPSRCASYRGRPLSLIVTRTEESMHIIWSQRVRQLGINRARSALRRSSNTARAAVPECCEHKPPPIGPRAARSVRAQTRSLTSPVNSSIRPPSYLLAWVRTIGSAPRWRKDVVPGSLTIEPCRDGDV